MNLMKIKMWCCIFVTFISLGIVAGREYMPKVRTEFGVYEGIWSETFRGEQVANYLGIPYAKPPTGEQRFKKPAPWTEQWRKVRRASNYPKSCAVFGETQGTSENCLFLNIFTRQLEQYARREQNQTNRAVLVFLISDLGGYSDNSLYNPNYLLDQDVVLVTVNFRQGVFGFFTTGDEIAPGNYGLKDVLEALHWLKRNVAAFGGDPDNVTLMGHGEGAGIVHLLVLSSKSEGLFHRYITQSGAAQSVWSYRSRKKVQTASKQLFDATNCTRTTSKAEVQCLQHIPVAELGQALHELVDLREDYGPTDEPDSEDAVITEHPKILMAEGKARDIPWMTGVVANEGLPEALRKIFNKPTVCSELAEQFSTIVFGIGKFEESIDDISGFIEELVNFYFDGNITQSDCADSLEEIFGDIMVNWPVYEALSVQLNAGMKSDIYFYHFAYKGTFTITFDLDDSKRYGISHGDELNYLFPTNELFNDLLLENTESDKTVINIVTEMWANFVKTGVPSASFSEVWEPYQSDKGYMAFGQSPEVTMKQDFLQDRMIFWSNLTEKYFIEPPTKLMVQTSSASSNWGKSTGNVDTSKYLLSSIVALLIGSIFNR